MTTYHAQVRRQIYRQWLPRDKSKARQVHQIAHELGTTSAAVESALRSEVRRRIREARKR